MNKALRVQDYLRHILQAVERIHRYTAGMDEAGFLANEMVQDAAIRNIEILGEAAKHVQRVAPAFAARHGDIPWQVMYTMRNRTAHGYDTVDLELVWKTIQHDLPGLYQRLQALASDVDEP